MPILENPRHEAFAQAGEASENPTLVNAARLAILDASRPRAALAQKQFYEHRDIDKVFNDMTAEEKPMQRPSPPREAPAAAPPAPIDRPARARSPPLPRRGVSPGAPRPLFQLPTSPEQGERSQYPRHPCQRGRGRITGAALGPGDPHVH